MKIIHIFNEFKFSGAEIMYVDAAPLFQEKKCQLTAVSTSDNLGVFAPKFEEAGYKLMHLPLPKLSSLWSRIQYYKDLISLLKKEKYDVVHIHRSDVMWGAAFSAWMAGKRSVYTFHNVFPTRAFTFLYHCFLRYTAKSFFGCKFQAISDSVYQHELNFYHNKTKKIYNWYSNKRFFPADESEKAKVRAQLAIPTDALVIISIGGCSGIKRHADIIKSIPNLVGRGINCIYLHLGDGETKCEEQDLAKELGIGESVRFMDNQTDVRKYLIASDIYVMTSRFEGISLTTMEALACKIPSILYNVPGLRDFNSTGENTLLIPEDFEILAENIADLHKNPQIREKLSNNGFAFVNSTFDMRRNTDEIYQLYTEK